jgi:hypothetical protein
VVTNKVMSTNDSLLYIQIATGALFCISELLGLSSCEYNGVFHFVFVFCHRRIYFNCLVEKEEEDVEMQNSERRESIGDDSFHSLPPE